MKVYVLVDFEKLIQLDKNNGTNNSFDVTMKAVCGILFPCCVVTLAVIDLSNMWNNLGDRIKYYVCKKSQNSPSNTRYKVYRSCLQQIARFIGPLAA